MWRILSGADLPTRIAFERERAVRDLSLRQEIGIQFGARHFLETGFELHGLESSLDQVIQGPRNESAANPSSVQGGAALPDLLVSEHSGVRGGAWVQDAYRVTDRFTVEPGLRLDWSTLNGRATLSPRFAASWNVGAGVQARAAGGLYTQSPGWEKLVSSDYLLDLNAIGDLFHERAVHAVAGLEKELTGGTRLRVEGYWKRFDDLLVGRLETEAERMRRLADYDFPAELAGSVPRDARITINPVNEGAGVARGLDVYLERLDPAARVAGWVSYSYGRAERETYGQRYPFEYDRPHALNVVGRIGITESWSLAATGRLASGFPYTPAVGVRVAAVEDDHGRLVPETDDDGNLAYAADLGRARQPAAGAAPALRPARSPAHLPPRPLVGLRRGDQRPEPAERGGDRDRGGGESRRRSHGRGNPQLRLSPGPDGGGPSTVLRPAHSDPFGSADS